MAAPKRVLLLLWELAARPGRRAFSRTEGTARSLGAEQLAEKLRAQKREQQKPQKEIPKDPVRRRVQELVQLTQQLQRVHPNVLAKALKKGILYQDNKIVVINKPYGLPVHVGGIPLACPELCHHITGKSGTGLGWTAAVFILGGPKVKTCIADVLPVLAKMLYGMKSEPLHLCHRLDKETTGVMVLAQDQDTAHQIHEFFRTQQVEKKYWAICIGQPKPTEGLVDIPIVEKEVESQQSHFKMALAPNYRMSYEDGKMFKVRQHRDAHMAVTRYHVLSSCHSCTFLELHPITGVKHQLRKLPQSTLKRLGLEQVKARYLPLHLHAYELILPEINGNREKKIHLVCKPPLFFSRSLKRLKLEFPESEKK
ncbi:hypothetical protein JD844_031315 [Phrynosoma platyrhinos]|uniref:Pseudouridylate synthase RPUSD4, mitochondrial n=1 Tax=Phrynosoma platyrhinos TaxID=52577 RepID=A0ABQ7T117_PHRPL|nr:hypothetical protein JD844_031315 [Phrynosoma platyrhinos]